MLRSCHDHNMTNINNIETNSDQPSHKSASQAGPCHLQTLYTSHKTAGSVLTATASVQMPESERWLCIREPENQYVLLGLEEKNNNLKRDALFHI